MYYVKESIKIGEGQYWERAVRKLPLKTASIAKSLCDRSVMSDNQPFVISDKGVIVHIGAKGKDY